MFHLRTLNSGRNSTNNAVYFLTNKAQKNKTNIDQYLQSTSNRHSNQLQVVQIRNWISWRKRKLASCQQVLTRRKLILIGPDLMCPFLIGGKPDMTSALIRPQFRMLLYIFLTMLECPQAYCCPISSNITLVNSLQREDIQTIFIVIDLLILILKRKILL